MVSAAVKGMGMAMIDLPTAGWKRDFMEGEMTARMASRVDDDTQGYRRIAPGSGGVPAS